MARLRHWWDNIRRIVAFLPVLWSDWDFDADGIYLYLRAKLARVQRCLQKGDTVDGPRDAEEIGHVLEALDRLIEDKYEDDELNELKIKWGCPAFDFLPWVYLQDGTRQSENFDWGNWEEKRKDVEGALEVARRKRSGDINFVFNVIRDNHLGWWC